MHLKISNIGLVKNAEIEIDSISILTGINGSGKSTVGKLLYSVATSLNLMDETSLNFNKYESIYIELKQLTRWSSEDIDVMSIEKKLHIYRRLLNNYRHLLLNPSSSTIDEDDIAEELNNIINSIVNEELELWKADISYEKNRRAYISLQRIYEKINLESNDQNIKSKILTDILEHEFSNNLTTNFPNIDYSHIEYTDNKNNKVDILLDGHEYTNINIDFDSKYSKSFYVDDPFLLDYRHLFPMNNPMMGFGFRRNEFSSMIDGKHNQQLIRDLIRTDELEQMNFFDEVILDTTINEIFSTVLDGILSTNGREFNYLGNNMNTAIQLENISSGLKSFSILYLLVKKNLLNNCEFLILDEPETNLHPEWQLKLAHLIILISERFPIKILIASHSPYFIEALELYSIKYNKENSVKYYTSENTDLGMVNIKSVDNDLSEIYNKLYEPLGELEQLRNELYEDD